jgi:hypothetical protein
MWKCHFRGQGSDSRVISRGPLLSLKSGYVTIVQYTNFRDCHYRTVVVIIYALTVRSYNELIKHLGIVGIVILRANNYTSIITSNNSTIINWGALTFNMFMSSAINGIPIAGVKALHHNMADQHNISMLLIIPSTTNTTVTVQESECRIAISFV